MNTRSQDRQRTLTGTPDTAEPDFAVLSGRVYRLCFALLGDLDAAGDAAQEALTRAWSRRKKKRPAVTWWTWSAGFAVRVCRELQRSRRLRVVGRSAAESPLDAVSEGLDSLEVVDSALVAAIHSLPRRQKEVTVLRFLTGQSVREVATTLGCPEGTVKSNLHKAMANLRTGLDARDAQWAALPSKDC